MSSADHRPPADPACLTSPTNFVDSDSAEVRAFVESALRNLNSSASDTEKAIRLFEAVRDGIRYDPYTFELSPDAYRASVVAGAESAFCVPKAIPLHWASPTFVTI